MAAENAKKFFEILNTDPEAQKLLKGCPKPENPEEVLTAFAELAEKYEISLSKEDFQNFLVEEEKAMESRTEAAVSQIQELPDEALDAVAGGGDHADCKYTFRDHENCWLKDGCDFAFRQYDDYGCYWNNNNACENLAGVPHCEKILIKG